MRVIASSLPWGELEGRTVLVTGANGFLPAAMVEVLLTLAARKEGPRLSVIALARSRANAERRFGAYLDDPSLTIHVGDVTQPYDPAGPIDIIVHAASQASPRYYGADPVGTAAANVLGASLLLELARRKNTQRFLYFSSSEVYGTFGQQQAAIGETSFGSLDPATPRACYAESKRMGETLCVAYHEQYGVPALMARPFHTYGPGMRLDDGRVFADFVRDIVMRQNISLSSDGSAERAFCYLADAVEAFFTVLFKGDAGKAYNIGNSRAVISIRRLAETLTGLYPDRRLSARFQPPQHSYIPSSIGRSAPDTTRLEALGWRPRTTIEEGFTRTIDVYEDVFHAMLRGVA